ncbi:hypothetical protein CYLTODRAFT_265356 [Cylindrobasidium torrendii FP15055 ss-10]|uniref:Uncharacterized protein n=1 Tax=Cylindrobasidium torrendii FP15055 ss-10 TaxID=1314674 RepID=A0A0D7BCN2_9AGAR|nr:hypothetical protein CYLTODRAFT_265356 [Cylindrobasidium torrendii FP15055 ss-10]
MDSMPTSLSKRARTTPPTDSLDVSVAPVQPLLPTSKPTFRSFFNTNVEGTAVLVLAEAPCACWTLWTACRSCCILCMASRRSLTRRGTHRIGWSIGDAQILCRSYGWTGESEQGQDAVCGAELTRRTEVQYVRPERLRCTVRTRQVLEGIQCSCEPAAQSGVGWQLAGTMKDGAAMGDTTDAKDDIRTTFRELLRTRMPEFYVRTITLRITTTPGEEGKRGPSSGRMFEVGMLRVLEAEEPVEVIWNRDAQGDLINHILG